MGAAGRWTRILAPAFGSPLTYGSLTTDETVAPGQISASELNQVYRVKSLDIETEIYGIIGNPVEHSLSPYLHNAAFAELDLNAVYIPFEVSDLGAFIKRMVHPSSREIHWNLRGFSVTIPFKEAIIEHLDFLDPAAKKIGAVNTVQIVGDQLVGFNTDAHGFIEPLRMAYGDLTDVAVAVFGSGGAARACVRALIDEGARPSIFARNDETGSDISREFGIGRFQIGEWDSVAERFLIAVNTTPLGTKGELENSSILTAGQIKNLQMIYDLVYNPFETLFLREAKSVDVPAVGGLAMLAAQGARQFKIWTGKDAPLKTMSRAALARL
jgi:3-dehydroquinate dehydratase/shikimate dehydrogenase